VCFDIDQIDAGLRKPALFPVPLWRLRLRFSDIQNDVRALCAHVHGFPGKGEANRHSLI